MLGTAAALALVWAMAFPARRGIRCPTKRLSPPTWSPYQPPPAMKVPTAATRVLSRRTAGPDGRRRRLDAPASTSTMQAAAERRATTASAAARSPCAPSPPTRATSRAAPACSSRETVGMRMADGSIHDGYWYASDTGGAIKGQKIDLYTGHGRGSMSPGHALQPAPPDHRRRRPLRRLPAVVGQPAQPGDPDGGSRLQRGIALKAASAPCLKA